jgi:hypothetical protein
MANNNKIVNFYSQLHSPNLFFSLLNDATFTGYSLPKHEWDMLYGFVGLGITQSVIDREFGEKLSQFGQSDQNNEDKSIDYQHVLLTNSEGMRNNVDFLANQFRNILNHD